MLTKHSVVLLRCTSSDVAASSSSDEVASSSWADDTVVASSFVDVASSSFEDVVVVDSSDSPASSRIHLRTWLLIHLRTWPVSEHQTEDHSDTNYSLVVLSLSLVATSLSIDLPVRMNFDTCLFTYEEREKIFTGLSIPRYVSLYVERTYKTFTI